MVLREARNVKYADFVAPGQILSVQAEIISQSDHETKLKVQGAVDGKTNVGARIVMARYNLADGNASRASADAHVIREMRKEFRALFRRGDKTRGLGDNGSAAAMSRAAT